MYTAHYGLRIKPFQISSDAAFIWLGEKHREALATLRYGILDNKGFLLLTGDVGTGKTTLINALIASLSKDVICASVPDPSLDRLDFFNFIGAAFGLGSDFTSKGKFLTSFTSFLHSAYDGKKKVLLIIDESQLMTRELLEEARLLSNIVTKDSNPLLNIFFVGQYEFNELIRRPENRAIAQRLTLNYYIEPLTLAETGGYIRHRLSIAGTTEKIFTDPAIKEIYAYSQGFPRKINIICDHCLMSGYAEDQRTISDAMARESARELQLPKEKKQWRPPSPSPVPQPPVAMAPKVDTVKRPIEQQAPPSRPERPVRPSFSRPIGGVLLLLMVLVSGAFFFLPEPVTKRFPQLDQLLSTIKKTTGLPSEPPTATTVQPKPPKRTVSPDLNLGSAVPAAPKDPPPDGKSALTKKAEQTMSVAVQGAEAKKEKELPAPGNNDAKPAGIPGIGRPVPQPAPAGPVVQVQPADQDVAGRMPEDPPRPLPEAPLVIRFQTDSDLFSVSDMEKMKEFARIVLLHPEATVNINGYTDAIGDEEYNRRLSRFRANMVKSFLMGQNLAPERMKIQGFGHLNPVLSNNTQEGRMMNRRVEIRVVVDR